MERSTNPVQKGKRTGGKKRVLPKEIETIVHEWLQLQHVNLASLLKTIPAEFEIDTMDKIISSYSFLQTLAKRKQTKLTKKDDNLVMVEMQRVPRGQLLDLVKDVIINGPTIDGQYQMADSRPNPESELFASHLRRGFGKHKRYHDLGEHEFILKHGIRFPFLLEAMEGLVETHIEAFYTTFRGKLLADTSGSKSAAGMLEMNTRFEFFLSSHFFQIRIWSCYVKTLKQVVSIAKKNIVGNSDPCDDNLSPAVKLEVLNDYKGSVESYFASNPLSSNVLVKLGSAQVVTETPLTDIIARRLGVYLLQRYYDLFLRVQRTAIMEKSNPDCEYLSFGVTYSGTLFKISGWLAHSVLKDNYLNEFRCFMIDGKAQDEETEELELVSSETFGDCDYENFCGMTHDDLKKFQDEFEYDGCHLIYSSTAFFKYVTELEKVCLLNITISNIINSKLNVAYLSDLIMHTSGGDYVLEKFHSCFSSVPDETRSLLLKITIEKWAKLRLYKFAKEMSERLHHSGSYGGEATKTVRQMAKAIVTLKV